MNTLILFALSSFFSALPIINEDIGWETTEYTLKKHFNVERAGDGSEHGHGYSDFTEINPIVYVDSSYQDKKIEYYFHNNKLYKIYTIYRSKTNEISFYNEKIAEFKKALGNPKENYTDELYSMPIQHYIWETENEKLDLRYGAGYVYEVRTNKKSAEEKQLKIDLKHAI